MSPVYVQQTTQIHTYIHTHKHDIPLSILFLNSVSVRTVAGAISTEMGLMSFFGVKNTSNLSCSACLQNNTYIHIHSQYSTVRTKTCGNCYAYIPPHVRFLWIKVPHALYLLFIFLCKQSMSVIIHKHNNNKKGISVVGEGEERKRGRGEESGGREVSSL